MISLRLSSEIEDLTSASIDRLYRLLKMDPQPETAAFLARAEGEKSFYDFFFDMLIENDASNAIAIDWRWEPRDVFWQLKKSFAESALKLVISEWLPSEESYRVEYMLDGKPESLLVALNNPNALLDPISQHFNDHLFVALDFLEDQYCWLVVPKDFDSEVFCHLTGLMVKKDDRKPELPKNFAEGYKQSEKLFFNPTIIYVDQNQIGYEMPGQIWAGRILPGQTIREGIAIELIAELNYSGRFDYTYDGYEGTYKDRKGHDVKRFRLTIYLYDKSFQSKVAGETDIRLKKIAGKSFSFPKSS